MTLDTNEKGNRIEYIDFLKFIGMIALITAHIGAPAKIMMIRNFDVPLMVILSAVLGERSFQRHAGDKKRIRNYYADRLKRLVVPTWIFLALYFVIVYFVNGGLFEWRYYVDSFLLTKYGIGYVWVILVYLYSALFVPLLYKIRLSKAGILCVAAIYIAYEVAYYFGVGMGSKVFDTTVNTIIPYGVLTFLGYNYFRMEKKYRYLIVAVAFLIFAGFGMYYWKICGAFQSVQIAKYPPRFYYMGFGIAVSFLLLLLCEKWSLKIYHSKLVRFVSGHSMWLYLWHILVLLFYGILKLPEIWYIKFPVVFMAAGGMVWIVNVLLDKIEKKKKIKWFRYLRG